MTDFDDEMADLAVELISEFPCPATWRVGPSESDFSISTGRALDVSPGIAVTVAAPQPYAQQFVNGSTVLIGDLRTFIASQGISFVPAPGASLTIGSDLYQVLNVNALASSSQIAAWEVQCRR